MYSVLEGRKTDPTINPRRPSLAASTATKKKETSKYKNPKDSQLRIIGETNWPAYLTGKFSGTAFFFFLAPHLRACRNIPRPLTISRF